MRTAFMGLQPRGQKHEDGVEEQQDRENLEHGQRPEHGRIGLEEFPSEALHGVPADREIQPVVDHEAIVA